MNKECKHKNHKGDRLVDISLMSKSKKGKDGCSSYCKKCVSNDTKDYTIRNKEKVKLASHNHYINNKEKYIPYHDEDSRNIYLEKKKQYYKDNVDKIKEYRQWYKENCSDIIKVYSSQYYKDNVDKIKEYRQNNIDKHRGNYLFRSAKRRAAKKQAIPSWFYLEQVDIRQLYMDRVTITLLTGIEHEVDHIVPLQHPLVCGLHCLSNLRIITAEENSKKHNKLDEQLLCL
jgi:hypothetical protein